MWVFNQDGTREDLTNSFSRWLLAKLVPARFGLKEPLTFLLDHPRRCFVYLFPSHQTWFLLSAVLGLMWAPVPHFEYVIPYITSRYIQVHRLVLLPDLGSRYWHDRRDPSQPKGSAWTRTRRCCEGCRFRCCSDGRPCASSPVSKGIEGTPPFSYVF
jgi:hypothetical protein